MIISRFEFIIVNIIINYHPFFIIPSKTTINIKSSLVKVNSKRPNMHI